MKVFSVSFIYHEILRAGVFFGCSMETCTGLARGAEVRESL